MSVSTERSSVADRHAASPSLVREADTIRMRLSPAPYTDDERTRT